MCAADGTHQTSMWSLLKFKQCPTVVSRLLSQCTRNSCKVSVARWCHASCQHLLPKACHPGACFRNPKKWKWLGARSGV